MNIIKILLLCCCLATAAVANEQYNNRQFRKIREQGKRINDEKVGSIYGTEALKQNSHVFNAVTEAPFLQHQQQLEKPQQYNLKKSQRINSRRITLADDNTIATNKIDANNNKPTNNKNNKINKNNNNNNGSKCKNKNCKQPLKRRNQKQNSANNNNNNNRRPNRRQQQQQQQIVIPAELLNNNNNNNDNNGNNQNNGLLSQLLDRMRTQFSQATTLLAFPFNGLTQTNTPSTQANNAQPPQQLRL